MSKRQPTQKTQPKGIDPATGKFYEPVEVPVPKRGDFDRLLKKAAKQPPEKVGKSAPGRKRSANR